MDRDGNRSNLYKPNPAKCCERCAFGEKSRKPHEPHCVTLAALDYPPIDPEPYDRFMQTVNNDPRNAVDEHVYISPDTEAAIDELEGPVDLHRFDDDGGKHA